MSDEVKFDISMGGDLSEQALDSARALAKLTRQMKSAEKQMKALRKHTLGKADAKGSLSPKFLDDINARLEKFKTPAQRAAEAAKKLRLEKKRLNEVARVTSRRINEGRGAVRSMGRAFGSVGRTAFRLAGGLGLVAAGAAALSGGLFAKSVADMSRFSQKSNTALALLTGSESGGRAAFEKSVSLSRQLGLNIEDTTHSMQKLLAQQFDLGESENLIKLGADLRAIGANAQDVQGVIRALTQIRGKGRLQGDEMIQLSEAGISRELVFKSLEQQFGKDRQAIQKMQEAGKIDSDSAIKAVEFAILSKTKTKKAGQAGAAFAQSTLDGAMGIFSAEKDNFLLKIAEGAAPAFKSLSGLIGDLGKSFNGMSAGGTFTRAFERIGEAVERMRPNIVDAFGKSLNFAALAFERLAIIGPSFLEGFFSGFVKNFSSFDETLSGGNIDTIMANMRVQGEGFGEEIGKLVVALPQLVGYLESVASVMSKITSIFGLLGSKVTTEGLESAKTGAPTAAGASNDAGFRGVLNSIFGTTMFTEFTGVFENKGASVVNGMIAGMESRKAALQAKSAEIARIPGDQFTGVNQIQSPSKLFRKHTQNIARGQILGFKDSRRQVLSASAGSSAGVASAGIASASATAQRAGSIGGGGNVFNQTFSSKVSVNEAERPGQTASEIAAFQTDGLFGAMVKSKVAAGIAA